MQLARVAFLLFGQLLTKTAKSDTMYVPNELDKMGNMGVAVSDTLCYVRPFLYTEWDYCV
jgi:phospholipase/lecithinase/hemolysin